MRHFTVDEANEALQLVRPLAEELVGVYKRAKRTEQRCGALAGCGRAATAASACASACRISSAWRPPPDRDHARPRRGDRGAGRRGQGSRARAGRFPGRARGRDRAPLLAGRRGGDRLLARSRGGVRRAASRCRSERPASGAGGSPRTANRRGRRGGTPRLSLPSIAGRWRTATARTAARETATAATAAGPAHADAGPTATPAPRRQRGRAGRRGAPDRRSAARARDRRRGRRGRVHRASRPCGRTARSSRCRKSRSARTRSSTRPTGSSWARSRRRTTGSRSQYEEISPLAHQGDGRDRGPAVLGARGARLRVDRARRLRELRGAGRRAGRLDDHTAARPQPLPPGRERADPRPEGQGGVSRAEAREGLVEGEDPRDVPEPGVLRAAGPTESRRRRRRTSRSRQAS